MADLNGTPGNDAIQPFGNSLLLTLSGTSAEGQPPVINVLVNGVVVVSGLSITADHSTGATQMVVVPLSAGLSVSSISLQYTNDTQASWEVGDRNLYVSSITLNGAVLPVSAGTYLRTADSSVITGQSDMIWGGSLDFAGPVVTGATVHNGGTLSVDGLGGIDTVLFANTHASYSVTRSGNGGTVSGNGETATLANVERLQFSDHSLALDMTGHAGSVAKIIAAVFGQGYLGVREFVGLGLDMLDGGTSAMAAAGMATSTTLFTQLAGSSSNSDFVKFIYHNVFGSDPSASDLNTYTNYLNTGTYTRAELAFIASDSSANAVHVVGVMDTGIQFV
ncbi:MAG: carbohydrate-binding domain-containing protein [Ramlibacter sp.]|nr:carbohydrate-binding domain-containing protein [Ramlibacter sp.]